MPALPIRAVDRRSRRVHPKDVKVTLQPSLEEYVNGLLETGGYAGADEVVAEALREHQVRHQGMEVVMTPELERLLDEGLENLPHAHTTEELRRRQ